MSRCKYLFLPLLALVLMGQGCFGGGGQTVDTTSDGGVFKTGDAGDTWVQVNTIPSPQGIGTISGTNVRTMEMDPQDKSVMYIGTWANGMLFTEDTANSWQQPRTAALQTGPINDIAVDPSDTCTVYIAKQERVYKTTDCARNFESETYVETRASTFVRRVAVDSFNPDVVWIGLSNGDVFKSTNGGDTWSKKLDAGSAVTDFLINAQDTRHVLVATERSGFQKTLDGGDSWTEIRDQIRGLRNAEDVYATVQTANSDTVVAATKYGLIRSNDFGDTWEALQLLQSAGEVTIPSLAMAPENANRLYYVSTNEFFASDDGGATWTTHQIPSSRTPEAMLIDPDDPSVLYVGVVQQEQ